MIRGVQTVNHIINEFISLSGKNQFDKVLLNLDHLKDVVQSTHHFSKEECLLLAGPGKSLIKFAETEFFPFSCKIKVLDILHILTSTPEKTFAKCHNKDYHLPPEVVSTIQRFCIGVLKSKPFTKPLNYSDRDFLQAIITSLGVLYNLIIHFPNETLGNLILNSCLPFAFYCDFDDCGFEHSFTEEVTLEKLSQQTKESQKPYVNKNRKKRLRRKKPPQSPASLLVRPTVDPLSRPRSDNKFTVPKILTCLSPPSVSLSSLSLKPQWMKSSNDASSLQTENNSSVKSDGASEKIPKFSVKPAGFTSSDPTLCSFPSSSESKHIDSIASESFKMPSIALDVNEMHLPSSGVAPDDGRSWRGSLLSKEQFPEPPVDLPFEPLVRRSALFTINAVIEKSSVNRKFGLWSALMCQKPSLMTIVLRDPSPSVRSSALYVISSFLEDSEKFLRCASDVDSGSSFTSFGRQVGASIVDLHRCLARALLSERNSNLLVKILKTLELLLVNVKYSNLKPGLLTKVISHVKYFLRYPDLVVRANAFSVMVCFLMMRPQVPEISSILLKYQTDAPHSLQFRSQNLRLDEEEDVEELLTNDESYTEESSEYSDSMIEEENKSSMVSWLVDRCVHSATAELENATMGFNCQVKFQALKVLSTLLSEHFVLVRDNIDVIQGVISICCKLPRVEPTRSANTPANDVAVKENSPESREIIVEHSYLLLGSLLSSVKVQLERKNVYAEVNAELSPLKPFLTLATARHVWLWALKDPLSFLFAFCDDERMTSLSADSGDGKSQAILSSMPFGHSSKVIASAADVFFHLTPEISAALPDPYLAKILDVARVLVAINDHFIRLSAFRVVGVLARCISLRDHPKSINVLSQTVECACNVLLDTTSSSTNKDRFISLWVLANIFKSIVSSVKNDTLVERREEVCGFWKKPRFLRVLVASKKSCFDKGKTRIHAAHCLGFAISGVPEFLASDPDVLREISESVSVLIDCSAQCSSIHARCYIFGALGNILVCPNLNVEATSWRKMVLASFFSLLCPSEVLRLRSLSASMLKSITSRNVFGPEFPSAWKATLEALENYLCVVPLTDSPEEDSCGTAAVAGQHQREYVKQLCLCTCNLIRLMNLNDMIDIESLYWQHHETLNSILPRELSNLPPDESTLVLQASENVKFLLRQDVLIPCQSSLLESLSETLDS